jgi:hypothetical protein
VSVAGRGEGQNSHRRAPRADVPHRPASTLGTCGHLLPSCNRVALTVHCGLSLPPVGPVVRGSSLWLVGGCVWRTAGPDIARPIGGTQAFR